MNKDNVISFLQDLGVSEKGKFEPERYILNIKDSDEYAKYYTILDQYDDLELSDDSSMSQEYATVLTYKNEDFKVSLNANFDDDYYTFVVEEL